MTYVNVIKSCASLMLLLAVLLPVTVTADDNEEPLGLLLTWQQDPTTTMTIDWHTKPGDDQHVPESTLAYKVVGSSDWQVVEASQHEFPHSSRTIHRIELTDLQPATEYRFRVGDFGRAYKFRTMPDNLNKPIVFINGGDTRGGTSGQRRMEQTNRIAMRYDPEFIVWGGDLAYADGREDRVYRWYEWFDAVLNTLVDDDGRVVPLILGIGNHEVQRFHYHRHSEYEQTDEGRERIAPFYYTILAFPGQPGYATLDFADYLSFILLDSDHTNPIEGEQLQWLEQVLVERTDVPHVFPVYHVPAYPSARDYDDSTATKVRNYWTPLFDEFGIRVAFEHHDHTYKRTYPLRGQQVHPNGTIYIGDGAWGVGTRQVHDPEETWYLHRAESNRNVIVVTLHGTHQHFLVVNDHGELLDEYPKTPASTISSDDAD